jgi:hypothetical protein
MHSEFKVAGWWIGVRTGKFLSRRPVRDDDLPSAQVQAICGERLEGSRQCLGLHSDTRRELPLGKGDFGDGAHLRAIMEPQKKGSQPLRGRAAFEIQDDLECDAQAEARAACTRALPGERPWRRSSGSVMRQVIVRK